MVIFETEVLDVIPRTQNVKSFRFKLDKQVEFKPGQFFFVSIKIAGQQRTKHFSFSNSPTEKGYIELTPEMLQGSVKFTMRDPGQREVIQSDVKFLYQALRRVFKPRGMRLKGTIEIENNDVVLNFNIKDFLDNLFEQFIKNKEE